MYLLDTDICSYLQGPGYERLKQKFASVPGELLAVSSITAAEVWYGYIRKDVGLRRLMVADDFLQGLNIAPWPVSAFKLYGRIRTKLEQTGRPIDDHDYMIAAHAIAIDATLVTNNTRHYERIGSPLRIENWL